MQNQRRFDQARNSRGIGRMPDVSFDRADIAELLLVRLALKNFPQRFKFNRVANRSARAMRLNVANGLDGDIGIRLRQGNGIRLPLHARSQERSRACAIVILPGAANDGIDRIAIGESISAAALG